ETLDQLGGRQADFRCTDAPWPERIAGVALLFFVINRINRRHAIKRRSATTADLPLMPSERQPRKGDLGCRLTCSSYVASPQQPAGIMSAQQDARPPSGPPYPPQSALTGGLPTVGVDVPISAVFLVLFIGSAVAHMTIFQINKRRGHKFVMSALMFGFSMARVVTMVMRIVWATRPTNVRVAIAAQIFTSAGIILLFIINLIFTQRILRAAHPHFGWHKASSIVFNALYALIIIMLIMVITTTVQSFYTLNRNTRRIDRNIQLTASSFLTFVCFLPLPLVILGVIVHRKTRLEKFGLGRWRTKVAILLASTTLLTLGAAFRCGTAFMPPRPRNNPAWYNAKWCYYFFNFVIEAIVLYLYILVRVDRRFHVPNGSKRAGDYSGRNKQFDKHDSLHSEGWAETRIMSEEEVFDDEEFCDCEEGPLKDVER
ncbi:hypothetical protein GJ744_011206, partial [Endocarpon pusillum]